MSYSQNEIRCNKTLPLNNSFCCHGIIAYEDLEQLSHPHPLLSSVPSFLSLIYIMLLTDTET